MRALRRTRERSPRRAYAAPRPPTRSILLVAVGGGAGTLARVALAQIAPSPPGAWPWTTLVVNVSGAFVLAVLLTLVTERITAAPWVRPLLGTGVLGSYTTFSALAYEIDQLLSLGQVPAAVGYTAASITGGLAAALAGVMAVRAGPPRTGAVG